MIKKPITDKNGEVRELTSEDMEKFKPASEVLPKDLLDVLKKRDRAPEKEYKKPSVKD